MTRTMLLAAAAALAFSPAGEAQQRPARLTEPRGFDFRQNGVWRPKARTVAIRRQAALAGRGLSQLNAPMRSGAGASSQMAVTGVLRMPILLTRYRNTDTTALRAAALYQDAMGGTPPAGRPYSLRTYYEEISNGLFSVRPEVTGWLPADSNDTFYEGDFYGLSASSRIAELIAEAVARADSTVDFGQFDNDGPDGIPNSGDDDGFVDIVAIIHPEIGGECGENDNIWAHRFSVEGWQAIRSSNPPADVVTADDRFGGGKIRVNDYIIQTGLGGNSSCDPAEMLGPGIIAHELGHGLGLPDFYDTQGNTQGIGHWGLMGAGNYRRPLSPAYMEGFSRLQLGWVTVREVTADGPVTLGAYPTSDSIVYLRPPVPNPRGEYYLLENRQGANSSDSALINAQGPGLLVWHVDSTKYRQGLTSNTVNTGSIYGLAVIEADGIGNLRSGVNGVTNRGDAGDPFPGSTGNTTFSLASSPAPRLNSGGFAGFNVDSISQVVPGGEMRFVVQFGDLELAVLDTVLRPARMGTFYQDTVAMGGGDGAYTFAVVNGLGTMPPGLLLSTTGIVTGVPVRDSTYNFTLRVTSGTRTVDLPLRIVVTAPVLIVANLVDQLLNGTQHLTTDEIRYLDLLGNSNNQFDIGDLAAWLDRTGTTLAPGVMARLMTGRPR